MSGGSILASGFARGIALVLLVTAVVAISGSARAGSDAKARARAQFERGTAAFEAGQFEAALSEYEAAYALASLPGFLFNIAQCHRNLGHTKLAIRHYRLYLERVPGAPNREAVEALLQELEERQRAAASEGGQQQRPALDVRTDPAASVGPAIVSSRPGGRQRVEPDFDPDPAPSLRRRRPEARSTPYYKRWWFWTAIGVAVGACTVGVVAGSLAKGPSLPDSTFGPWDVSLP